MAMSDGAPRHQWALALIACAMLSACASNAPVGEPATPLPAAPPPAATSAAQAVSLTNPGFESDKPGVGSNSAEGWTRQQHAGPTAYTFIVDREMKRSGEASMRIRNLRPEVYGSITQRTPAAPHIGKTLRFSVWLRTEDVVANVYGYGATPLLQAWGGGSPAASASYEIAAIAGTTNWVRREVTIEVPGAAEWIEVGVLLHGSGTVWLDDVVLEAVAAR